MSISKEPACEELMRKVEQFIEQSGNQNVNVNAVFIPDMFQQLDRLLQKVGWKSMQMHWEQDHSIHFS